MKRTDFTGMCTLAREGRLTWVENTTLHETGRVVTCKTDTIEVELLASSDVVVEVTGEVPAPQTETEERALRYMDLEPGRAVREIELDRVFIGSCTNSRIGDLREAAAVVEGRRVASTLSAMVVPGSALVKAQAEAEGLDEVFRAAGFDWRSAGCSMCLGMNPDILSPGERCASTSNRNFEGRQGKGGRTHLVSPKMAAAAAIEGRFVDIRDWS